MIKQIDNMANSQYCCWQNVSKRDGDKNSNNDKTWPTHDESGVGLAELVSRSTDVGAKIFILIKFQ